LATLQPIVHETQFAGQPTSDLAICDTATDSAHLLPGASDPDEIELFPCWTPDGKSLVFCWAPSGVHPALVKYDLRVIPFDEGKGGKASPIPGASNNSRSNYYPRFSPDGKWLSFCQSDGGCLIKSSSDIFLMPAGLKGPPRKLACNAPHAADSWHSWSSNSRWLVFASKRDDGVFARLYLTHIDEKGRSSPAIRIPVRKMPLQCFNIPEFLNQDPLIRETDLYNVLRVENAATPVTQRKDSS
jgi:Tol biopolymer transport system component